MPSDNPVHEPTEADYLADRRRAVQDCTNQQWAEMYCALRRAEKRIQKHRRIITRLLAMRRASKEAARAR